MSSHYNYNLQPPSAKSHYNRPNTSPIAQHKTRSHNNTSLQLTADTILQHLNIELTEATQRAHTSHGRHITRPSTSNKQRSDSMKRSWNSAAVNDYTFGETIGEGTFGKVKRGTHKLSNCSVAIKILEKDRIIDLSDIERVKREISILCKLSHQNCIQLYQIIDSHKHIFLIMEYCSNGELFDYIVQNSRIDEYESCRLFHHIINGISHCHTYGIIHRDLKPENLLLTNNYQTIKIVDFGLSNTCDNNKLLQTACGSPCYAAPEMIKGQRYMGRCVDIWSCGVILYALLCGYLPFEDGNTSKLYDKIIHGQYTIPSHVSNEATDLIQKILNTDPNKRYTIQQIRQHKWYAQCSVDSDTVDGSMNHIQHNTQSLDSDVLYYMSTLNYNKLNVINSVQQSKYNHDSATYQLLLLSKQTNKWLQQRNEQVELVHESDIVLFDPLPNTYRQLSMQSQHTQHDTHNNIKPVPVPSIPNVRHTRVYTQHNNNNIQPSTKHRADVISPYITQASKPARPSSHRSILSRKSIPHTTVLNNVTPSSPIHTAYKRPNTSTRYQPLHVNIQNITVPPINNNIITSNNMPNRPPTSTRKPAVPRQAVIRLQSAKLNDRRHSTNGAVLNNLSSTTAYNNENENYSTSNHKNNNNNHTTHRLYTLNNTTTKPRTHKLNDGIISYRYSNSNGTVTDNISNTKSVPSYNNLYTLSYNTHK